jgi:hypothetical protein
MSRGDAPSVEGSAGAAPPDRCPLCGGGNACAMAAGDASPCWCLAAVFDEALLARVPPAARGRACICPACAAAEARAK